MIELVPDPKLEPGLYGILFSPNSGIIPPGGQRPGWTSVLAIDWDESSGAKGPCIVVARTGGLAGVIGIGAATVEGSSPSFPLLDRDRMASCPGSAASPASAVTKPPREVMTDAVNAGEVVKFPVKFVAGFPPNTELRTATLELSKTAVILTVTSSTQGFSVSPGQITDMKVSGPELRLRMNPTDPRTGRPMATQYFTVLDPKVTNGPRQPNGFVPINWVSGPTSLELILAILQVAKGG